MGAVMKTNKEGYKDSKQDLRKLFAISNNWEWIGTACCTSGHPSSTVLLSLCTKKGHDGDTSQISLVLSYSWRCKGKSFNHE